MDKIKLYDNAETAIIKFLLSMINEAESVDIDFSENATVPYMKQIRSLFTTYCLLCHIDADTYDCQRVVNKIYEAFDKNGLDVDYNRLENYLVANIV